MLRVGTIVEFKHNGVVCKIDSYRPSSMLPYELGGSYFTESDIRKCCNIIDEPSYEMPKQKEPRPELPDGFWNLIKDEYTHVAKDFYGHWYLFTSEPFVDGSMWNGKGRSYVPGFVLPDVDWKDSLYERPRNV